MDNKVLNKQIPIKTIVDIANYFEEYKERYSDLFQKDQEKNEKLNFSFFYILILILFYFL